MRVISATAPVNDVAFSPDGTLLAAAGEDGHVRVWDLNGGLLAADLSTDAIEPNPLYRLTGARALAFSSDGTRLAWGGAGYYEGGAGQVRVSEVNTWRPVDVLASYGVVNDLAFSAKGAFLAVASNDQTCGRGGGGDVVWDLSARQPLTVPHGVYNTVTGVAFSPDGVDLVDVSFAERCLNDAMLIRVWDVAKSALVEEIQPDVPGWYRIAFSPDGRTVASGSRYGSIGFWDVTLGALERLVPAHTDAIWGIAYSPDGSLLATAGADRAVRIWSVESGALAREWTGLGAEVTSVAFSPDGQWLAAGCYDGTIQLRSVH